MNAEYQVMLFFVPCFLRSSFFLFYHCIVKAVSCSCSFVCAVPGAAICRISGGGGECTMDISSVNCKQQVQYVLVNHQIYTHIYIYAPRYQVQRVQLGLIKSTTTRTTTKAPGTRYFNMKKKIIRDIYQTSQTGDALVLLVHIYMLL